MKRSMFLSLALVSLLSIGMAQPIIEEKVPGDFTPARTHKANGNWDVQFSTTMSGQMTNPIGAAVIGDTIYMGSAVVAKLYKIVNNVVIDSFTVSGISVSSSTQAYCVGLAYDGTNMYLANGDNKIYKLAADMKSVASTITLSSSIHAGYIAYDANADNGNGGLYTGISTGSIYLVSLTGNTLQTITMTELGYTCDNGFWGATMDNTNGYLYLLERYPQNIVRIDPSTKKINAPIHCVADDKSAWANYYAYGIYIQPDIYSKGTTTLGVTFMAKYHIGYDFSTVILSGDGIHVAGTEMEQFQKVNTPKTIHAKFANTGKNALKSYVFNYEVDGNVYADTQSGKNYMDYIDGFTLTHATAFTPTQTDTKYNMQLWLSDINGTGINSDTLAFTFESYDNAVQRNVLHEAFSSATCSPCKSGNANLKKILDANDNWTCIKYQVSWPGNGDPYYTTEGNTRRNYYGVKSVPHMFSDGKYWDGNSADYTTQLLRTEAAKPSFIDHSATLTYDGNKKFNATVTLDPIKTITGDNRLFVALVENKTVKNIADEYLNYYGAATFYAKYDTVFHHVMKKFMTDATGQKITLKEGEQVNLNFEYEFKGSYRLPADASDPINHSTENSVENFNHIYLVYWIQNYNSKEVLQSGKAGKASAINEAVAAGKVSIYPNPAQNILNIASADEVENVDIYNMLGQKVMSSQSAQINISNLSNGMYIVNVRTNAGTVTSKFVKE